MFHAAAAGNSLAQMDYSKCSVSSAGNDSDVAGFASAKQHPEHIAGTNLVHPDRVKILIEKLSHLFRHRFPPVARDIELRRIPDFMRRADQEPGAVSGLALESALVPERSPEPGPSGFYNIVSCHLSRLSRLSRFKGSMFNVQGSRSNFSPFAFRHSLFPMLCHPETSASRPDPEYPARPAC